ncbi:hypothetical protein KP509_20G071800 [Ceratopteris richardii]|uniref:SKP1-like protein n=1 Tax=Ceratopteris richardii TaxID=49495 RepID=A0A8T2SJM6_CERRI|nr:hypothetical protein KP509_20G071800 [Ceratopteris richardii]
MKTLEELKVKLKSADDELFEVEEIVALESRTIKDIVEDIGIDCVIPLLNVSSQILSKIIKYCRYHALEVPNKGEGDGKRPALSEEDVTHWDGKFLEVDQATLFDLILAANYLNIQSLLDLTCQRVADMIKEKTPEEIRRAFNIENDFTPEEEEEVRRENQWAFE